MLGINNKQKKIIKFHYKNKYGLFSRLLKRLRPLFSAKNDRFCSFLKGNKSLLGKHLERVENIQDYISTQIYANVPFFVGRFGSNEAHFLSEHLFLKLRLIKTYDKDLLNRMFINAGFFSVYDRVSRDRFCTEFARAISNMDVCGYWKSGFQEMLIDTFGKNNLMVTQLRNLEPYFNKKTKPWTLSLKGKKVVVVHPFSDTISKQYANRNKIWSTFEPDTILPSFNLRTVKAVQTIAGNNDTRFLNWFDALKYMEDKCFEEDFDVCIIGCGSYGVHLASRIRERGKIAIVLGSAVQFLFGIKGKRYDDSKDYNCYYNEYWVRPSMEETPNNIKAVEDGCYW